MFMVNIEFLIFNSFTSLQENSVLFIQNNKVNIEFFNFFNKTMSTPWANNILLTVVW